MRTSVYAITERSNTPGISVGPAYNFLLQRMYNCMLHPNVGLHPSQAAR